MAMSLLSFVVALAVMLSIHIGLTLVGLEPAFFDLPFISSDPDLVTRTERDPEYRDQLIRTLSAEARQRARKR